jgi:peptide/nickel transport system substrate-binding protein
LVFQYPRSYIFSADEIAQAIAGYLGVIGINVDLQGMDYNAFFSLWASRKLPGIHMFSNGPLLLDADSPLTSLYESGQSRILERSGRGRSHRQQRGEWTSRSGRQPSARSGDQPKQGGL